MHTYEYNFTEHHMGTEANLALVCRDERYAQTIATDVFSRIAESEQRFSRFRATSELSVLNTTRRGRVSEEFFAVLARSIELCRATGVAFNPLARAASLGYRSTLSELPPQVTITPTTYNTNCEHVTMNETTREVTLAPEQQLDLGGIVKGYLATALAEHISATYPECTGAIINLGGDIATRGRDAAGNSFQFFLYNPITTREIPITLSDTALATSGTYKRTWQTNLGPRHHIVDTSTRENPATTLVSVSIVHPDGALTEALTKLFLVRGVAAATTLIPPANFRYRYYCVYNDGHTESNLPN